MKRRDKVAVELLMSGSIRYEDALEILSGDKKDHKLQQTSDSWAYFVIGAVLGLAIV